MTIVVDNAKFEDPDSIVMADDGKGESVNIPTFMISSFDGEKLKEAIHKETDDGDDVPEDIERNKGSNKVIIQANIAIMEKTDGIIDVDFWYTGAYELLQAGIDFSKYS